MNILFTCAGRRVSLLDHFRRTMADMEVTGNIVATDITMASAAFQHADAGVLVPRAGTVEYIPALLELCVEHDIDLVIPLTDTDIRSLARHGGKFAERGTQVMVGPADTILRCRDKTLTNRLLTSLGLSGIRTFTLEQFRSQPFFPCFIKPIRGSAGVGAGMLHSEPELNAHLATYGDLMLLQDYVPGAEYTLDIYRRRDGQVPCVVPRQRLSIRAGEVEKSLTVNDKKLIEAGVRLGEALDGMWGVFNAQCRQPAGDRAHFFEINPRFGGGCLLSIAAGADLPRYVLEDALGLPVSAKIGQFKADMLMLRYDEAIYIHADDPRSLPGYDSPTKR